MWRLLGMGERKLIQKSRSHDQDGTMPHMVKTFKNLLLWNLQDNDLETWYAVSSTSKYVQMMLLGWPWPILWQVKSFVWEKVKTTDFSETIVVYDITDGRCSQLKWGFMSTRGLERSGSFTDLGPNHSASIFVNFFSSIIPDFNISSALRWAI